MTDDADHRVDVDNPTSRQRRDAAGRGILDHPAERGELFSPEELAAAERPNTQADRDDRRTV